MGKNRWRRKELAMSNNHKKTNDNEICLLCGNWKEEESLVCHTCFQEWYNQWNKEEEFPYLIVWVFSRVESCCVSINEELEQAKSEFERFKKAIKQEAYKRLTRALKGAYVADFSLMLEDQKKKLWKQRDGDKLYGRLKRTEVRAQKLPELLKELGAKIEQYEEEAKKAEAEQDES